MSHFQLDAHGSNKLRSTARGQRIGATISSCVLLIAMASARGRTATGASTVPESPQVLPGLLFRPLDRAEYIDRIQRGELVPGVAFDQEPDSLRPSVVFIHGVTGTPALFERIARPLRDTTNLVAFVYDDRARLATNAELLRRALLRLGPRVLLVGHSLGALLAAYVGATDRDGEFARLRAIYVNPLIGGSHYADDIFVLRWLRPVKPAFQRALFPPYVQDLIPESEFQQKIFGYESARSSFSDNTILLFTERPGEEPDILVSRVPMFFGRQREDLLARMGKVVRVLEPSMLGHDAPLSHPELVLSLLDGFHTSEPSPPVDEHSTMHLAGSAEGLRSETPTPRLEDYPCDSEAVPNVR